MKILPIALTPKKILLIGAGQAAALKARGILESDCDLTIIAREIKDDFFADKNVTIAPFAPENLAGFEIVINATGDFALSEKLWNLRKEFGFILNSVDTPDFCDFYFTANHREGDLCVSVSTGGASPAFARKTRDLIKAVLPARDENFYASLREKRAEPRSADTIYLISCGAGKKENLTIKALNAIKNLEAALIDALIGDEITRLLPESCEKIYVGKQKGAHSFSQDEINEIALNRARSGKVTGRLKGGDLALFGRFYEEAATFAAAGFKAEAINGVSSAFAASAASGVPITLRGVSAGALIVSAHLKESLFNGDWIEFLRGDFKYTIVVLMAHSFAGKITAKAYEIGVDLTIPAAFVSAIDGAEQTAIVGDLARLEIMAARCGKPAILIIGKAVAAAADLPRGGEREFLP
ncbi:MAG: siroheme synthase [Helicobacteraceae bacterium]|jgi:uroporphyrin-III C-methyltransferase/precorrin-2 dehydrogenase/sirohydrochlorin ferrochelatase|nr:siroheme synthase [Helicobacteraceae bacterium]